MMILSRGIARVLFVRGVSGTSKRVYLVQVSDQRGTCLVEKPTPAKGGLCLQQPLKLFTKPALGTKLLEISLGRGFEALKGLNRTARVLGSL